MNQAWKRREGLTRETPEQEAKQNTEQDLRRKPTQYRQKQSLWCDETTRSRKPGWGLCEGTEVLN